MTDDSDALEGSPSPRGFRASLPKLVVSLVIGAGFAWLLERGGLPLLPPASVFSGVAWWAAPAAVLTHVVSSYYRTCRLVYLLRPIAPELSFFRVLGIGFVGFTAVVLAPLRTGEVVRPYLLSRDGRVTFTQALGATVAERIIDGFLVAVTLFGGLLFAKTLSPLPDHLGSLHLDVALVRHAAYTTLVLFAAAFGGMIAFQWKRALVVRLIERVLGAVSQPLASAAATQVSRLADGLGFLMSRDAAVPFATRTVAYYGALVIGHWAVLHGVGLPATLSQTWVVLGVLSVAILVPAGPGFFGAYQLSIYYALAMFFPEQECLTAGAAFVFLTYAAQIGVTLLGLVAGLALMAANPKAVGLGGS